MTLSPATDPVERIAAEFDVDAAAVEDCTADIAAATRNYCDEYDVEPSEEFIDAVQHELLGRCLKVMRDMRANDVDPASSALPYTEPEQHFRRLAEEMDADADSDSNAWRTNLSVAFGALAAGNDYWPEAREVVGESLSRRYSRGDDS